MSFSNFQSCTNVLTVFSLGSTSTGARTARTRTTSTPNHLTPTKYKLVNPETETDSQLLWRPSVANLSSSCCNQWNASHYQHPLTFFPSRGWGGVVPGACCCCRWHMPSHTRKQSRRNVNLGTDTRGPPSSPPQPHPPLIPSSQSYPRLEYLTPLNLWPSPFVWGHAIAVQHSQGISADDEAGITTRSLGLQRWAAWISESYIGQIRCNQNNALVACSVK